MADTDTSRPAKLRSLAERDLAVQDGDAQARRSLNALAMTSNIVSALIQFPGAEGDHRSMVDAARAMLGSADDTTTQLIDQLNLGNVSWARFRIMRMASEAVSNRWVASARADGRPSADISAYLPVWKEMAAHKLPEFQFEEPAQDDRVALQIALLDALQPVMREIAVFDLFHDHKAAAMHAREVILETVAPVLKELLPPVASDRSHKQLQQALLRNAGSVYASAWRKHAEDVVDRLGAMSSIDQEAAVAEHPKGFPLVPVDKSFRTSFTKLAEMVSYLAQPVPGAQARDNRERMLDNVSEDVPVWADEGPNPPDDEAFAYAGSVADPGEDARPGEGEKKVR